MRRRLELGLVVDVALLIACVVVIAWALGADLPLDLHL